MEIRRLVDDIEAIRAYDPEMEAELLQQLKATLLKAGVFGFSDANDPLLQEGVETVLDYEDEHRH